MKYLLTLSLMKLEKKLQLKNLEHDRVVIERLVDENISGKLDKYLKKLDGEDVEGEISFVIEENKIGRFNGTLNVFIDGKTFHYEREDFKKLDDLINHFFDHLKEDLGKI
ncbi:hypothetical protein CO024_01320 [Candidatus Gracilibacteria bacterium CG_4_9_14_0_2_um_filter_38_7]|nr:MAG: hypothetical protein AUJ87_02605 [Candidatus Gracilibacteria bacterium CG1_02_38_174]PIQ12275.1 MAG: hypothetical protein COW68_00255 [Candidatus Gracilibacteria bacterium CG18_big_fil_WC_8_21_14_2_50_38_16]PIQ42191.1 MAG: hypothetical protein COW06_00380 [Candidatus Gracilibacteria bacterium CG12_big_fil_rev_8_21_14_0_65_38_15]PIZ01574.1 MAG: hypothetical protein COY60_02780 [Candidatus Gracilibacteria bacterium CG_4_10_14_0_8_um_filter_38_28]PJC56768.1 MAG: hypothetical protein CO024_